MSNKSKATTFLLCYFFGPLGVHRFYAGKFITGLLMLLTLGGLLIWWMVDLYRIAVGRFTDKDGNDLRTAPRDPSQTNAGFWVRVAAMIIDGLLLGAIQFVFIYLPFMAYLYNLGIFNIQDPEMMQGAALQLAPITLAVQGVVLLLYVGYFVVLTAGKRQGTIGKSCMGIHVQKRDGGRIWYGTSVVRFVGYIISWIPLGLGYLMAAFSKRKLALHDIIAGTEVVFGAPSSEAAEVHDDMGAEVDHEAVTEVSEPAPEPFPAAMQEARPSRVPEIMVGTGLLLIAGSMALMYMR